MDENFPLTDLDGVTVDLIRRDLRDGNVIAVADRLASFGWAHSLHFRASLETLEAQCDERERQVLNGVTEELVRDREKPMLEHEIEVANGAERHLNVDDPMRARYLTRRTRARDRLSRLARPLRWIHAGWFAEYGGKQEARAAAEASPRPDEPRAPEPPEPPEPPDRPAAFRRAYYTARMAAQPRFVEDYAAPRTDEGRRRWILEYLRNNLRLPHSRRGTWTCADQECGDTFSGRKARYCPSCRTEDARKRRQRRREAQA